MEPSIPMEKCIHGHLYRIHSRNLDLGVYREDVQGFIGIREKFGDRYLFTEYHFDTGPPYGTVHPKEDLGPCPLVYLEEGRFSDNRWHENKGLFTWLDAKDYLMNDPYPAPGCEGLCGCDAWAQLGTTDVPCDGSCAISESETF